MAGKRQSPPPALAIALTLRRLNAELNVFLIPRNPHMPSVGDCTGGYRKPRAAIFLHTPSVIATLYMYGIGPPTSLAEHILGSFNWHNRHIMDYYGSLTFIRGGTEILKSRTIPNSCDTRAEDATSKLVGHAVEYPPS